MTLGARGSRRCVLRGLDACELDRCAAPRCVRSTACVARAHPSRVLLSTPAHPASLLDVSGCLCCTSQLSLCRSASCSRPRVALAPPLRAVRCLLCSPHTPALRTRISCLCAAPPCPRRTRTVWSEALSPCPSLSSLACAPPLPAHSPRTLRGGSGCTPVPGSSARWPALLPLLSLHAPRSAFSVPR